jgi:hypothetical protein
MRYWRPEHRAEEHLGEQQTCASLAWIGKNRTRRVRARAEHPYNVVKHRWGFTKVRCRGLAKNTVRARRHRNVSFFRDFLVPEFPDPIDPPDPTDPT